MYRIIKAIFLFVLFIFLISINTGSSNAAVNLSSSWQTEVSLPHSLSSHQTISYNNKLYVLGGAGQGDVFRNEILTSNLLPTGSLSPWEVIDTLPQALVWHTVSLKNNNLYLFGGATRDGSINSTSSVYLSTIQSNGTLSDWVTLNPLPESRALGGTVIYGDWIYYIGGFVHSSSGLVNKSTVFKSRINPDNTIESWQAAAELPDELSSFALFEKNGYIYVAGGRNNSAVATNKVYRSKVNLDGSLTNWVTLDDLPENTHRPGYFIDNNDLYTLGGLNGSDVTPNIYKTVANQDGTLENWTLLSNVELPISNCCFTVSLMSNKIYSVGGHNLSNYLPYVYSNGLTGTDATFLNVPDFKQYDGLWGNLVYDSANSWSPSNPSISRWGCAITSAAMVLNFHGGTTTPELLNNWLKTNNGYTRNGAVLWPSISKFAKDDPNIPSLEFTYKNYTDDLFKTEINENRPPILKLANVFGGNHFIAGRGFDDNNLFVNDPGRADNDTLSKANTYWGSALQLGQFKPSNTDLSYIVLLVDKGFDLKVSSPSGEILDPIFFTEEGAMMDPNNPNSDVNVETLQAFYYPKPENGDYKVEVEGNGNYQLDIYLYDQDGVVKEESFTNTQTDGKNDLFVVNFSSENSQNSDAEEISHESLLNNWNQSYPNLVKNKAFHTAVKQLLEASQKRYVAGKTAVAKELLSATEQVIQASNKKFIDQNYKVQFLVKLGLLKNSL